MYIVHFKHKNDDKSGKWYGGGEGVKGKGRILNVRVGTNDRVKLKRKFCSSFMDKRKIEYIIFYGINFLSFSKKKIK